MDKAFVFDFDGVIVDSLPALFQAYCSVMSELGVYRSVSEFMKLNGPNLPTICEYLISEHDLSVSFYGLMTLYEKMIQDAYQSVIPNYGIKEVLQSLGDDCPIGLATSSNRVNVLTVLDRFDLRKHFEFIICGEDVTKPKPDPEIYNKARSRFEGYDIYVVEDSFNGVESANYAGAKVIGYGPDRFKFDCYSTIENIKDIIDYSYDARLVDVKSDKFSIDNMDRFDMSVSGVVIDDNNCTLVGMRTNVSTYQGWYELIPSGHWPKERLFSEQLLDEFEEESGLSRDKISQIELLDIVHDINMDCYDAVAIMRYGGSLLDSVDMVESDEYEDIKVVKISDLKKNSDVLIPTSRVIVRII